MRMNISGQFLNFIFFKIWKFIVGIVLHIIILKELIVQFCFEHDFMIDLFIENPAEIEPSI